MSESKNISITHNDFVAVVRLERPDTLNALSASLLRELTDSLKALDDDRHVRSIVLAGGDRAFAAGADIKEMMSMSYMDVFTHNLFAEAADRISSVRKPLVAAVEGYALGGGFELALMADILIAADNAVFGLPEILLGVIPGIGGTQRLTRIIGKAKAMEMCLTGRTMNALEAERLGIVTRIVPVDSLMSEAMGTANSIAHMSLPAVMMAKECVNRVYESTLSEGIRYERRLFHSLFSTSDQKEGMAAFVNKRKPQFIDE